jgi:hypothetical protein
MARVVQKMPSGRRRSYLAQIAVRVGSSSSTRSASRAVAPFTYRAVAPDLFGCIVNAEMATDDSSLRIRSTSSQRAER